MKEATKIADPALIPGEVITKDKGLQATIKQSQMNLDRHRWESTMCPGNQYAAEIKAYATAVGVGTAVIKSAIEAWAAHGIECTDPSHIGGKAVDEVDLPTEREHAISRAKSRGKITNSQAAVAYSEATGTPVRVLEDVHQDEVKAVVMRANELAAEGGNEEPDDVAYGRAAREIAHANKELESKRKAIKEALMDAKGVMDPKLITADEVDKAMVAIEMDIALADKNGDPYDSWEAAVADFVEHEIKKHAEEKAASKGTAKLRKLRVDFTNQVSAVRVALLKMNGMAREFKVETGLPADAKSSYLHSIDLFIAELTAIKNLIEATDEPMGEAADWDKALAALTAGE